jgi:hypothetical protein
MKFTPYQHKRIAERYLAKTSQAFSKEENAKWTKKAEKHIEAYIKMTGNLPE